MPGTVPTTVSTTPVTSLPETTGPVTSLPETTRPVTSEMIGIMANFPCIHTLIGKYSTLAVFGFNQTEFRGMERGERYAVELGFLQGRSSGLVIATLTLNFGTAGNFINNFYVLMSLKEIYYITHITVAIACFFVCLFVVVVVVVIQGEMMYS